MNLGTAIVVFKNIEVIGPTEDEKAMAIYKVMNMATHNCISKDDMLKVIKWLFDKLYEVENV